jgi:predicted PolB exonuclease-like 3'-5' exonuclease
MSYSESEHYLVFDIETSPLPWESFSESQQEYILRGAATDGEKEKKRAEMALSPLTSQVVCIGLQLIEISGQDIFTKVKRKAIAVDNDIESESRIETLTTGDECKLESEKDIIADFWEIFDKEKYRNVHLISFNGRNFDAPYLMLRSAMLSIKPSRNLMAGTKFNYPLHTDLLDELTFYSPGAYGATKRFNFDFYTRQFGIKSPKSEGIDGSMVAEYFYGGRILEIAEYCLRDVIATWELFLKWREFLRW